MSAVARENLLPANATAFEDAQSQASARILDAPVQVIRDARKGATAPKPLLPWLAWERSVHHPSDDEATMRARIDSSFADHLSYGAPVALEAEIALDVGLPVGIVEFWQENGLEWPDFVVEVEVDQGTAPLPDLSAVLPSALRRKNVRDWPKAARLRSRTTPTDFHVGSATFVGARVRVLPADGAPPVGLHIGSATFSVPTLRILPL